MARLVFGTGAHTYDIYPSFGELPAGWEWGNVSNVACDSQDRVYAFQRKDPPIVIFDSDGRYVDSWGTGEMLDAHGIFIGPGDEVYLLDRDAHELLKYTSDGKLLLRVGTRGRAHLQAPFNHPADVAVAPNGDIFVADGYGNSSVHRYTADGTHLFSWGIPGENDGEFSTPHGIWVDARSRVYVTDRENNCIQIFDAAGTFVRQAFVNRGAESALTVAGIAFSPDPEQRFVYVADQGNSHIHVLDRETLETLDSFGRNGAAPGEFQALHHIASDSEGNLYTAEAQRGRRVQKFTLTGYAPTDEARRGSAADGAAGGDAASRWTAPRTAWGEPDLQGLWTSATLTPLERPERQAERSTLTDEEAAAIEAESAARRAASDGRSAPGSVGGYNQVWMDAGTRIVGDRRTALIVDPPDGRIPWHPHARVASDRERARYGVGPFESYTDLDTGERCITDGLPNMVPLQPYNMNMHIFQSPGEVVMLHEMYHELRVIPLDGRPRNGIPQWTGEARGHWEGDTLVVETINFAERPKAYWSAPWRASRPSLRLVERFTRVGPETIDYTFTLEDPLAFTRPWTAAAPMTTDHASRGVTAGQLWEYACHEGNYGMLNILSGARAEEAEAAAADR